MGSSASCDDSVSVSIGFRSCLYSPNSDLYSPNSEELWVKHEKSSYGNVENVKEIILDDLDSLTSEEEDEDFKDSTVKENVKEIFLEDLDSSTSEEDEEFKDSIVKGLGISLCETLQIRDPPELSYVRNSALNEENKCNQLKAKPLSFDTDVLEGLNKHATILCSGPVQSYLANSDVGDGLSCVTVQSENSSEAENLAFVQPLLTTTTLIPALKGSRATHGKHLNAALSVKWAPEVYDPPVTLSSHTVKGNQRRQRHHHHHHHAMTKKDHHNQKYIKGKSSKRTVTERKHSHRRSSGSSITDPRILSLQEPGCSLPRPLQNSCGQSKIDLAVRSHEAIKYGSTCYVDPLAPVQLPLAKAS